MEESTFSDLACKQLSFFLRMDPFTDAVLDIFLTFSGIFRAAITRNTVGRLILTIGRRSFVNQRKISFPSSLHCKLICSELCKIIKFKSDNKHYLEKFAILFCVALTHLFPMHSFSTL